MALSFQRQKKAPIKPSEDGLWWFITRPNRRWTIGLGKDIGGTRVVADLAKMPVTVWWWRYHRLRRNGRYQRHDLESAVQKLMCARRAVVKRLTQNAGNERHEGIPHLLCPVVTGYTMRTTELVRGGDGKSVTSW
jgi:hypothetical protein